MAAENLSVTSSSRNLLVNEITKPGPDFAAIARAVLSAGAGQNSERRRACGVARKAPRRLLTALPHVTHAPPSFGEVLGSPGCRGGGSLSQPRATVTVPSDMATTSSGSSPWARLKTPCHLVGYARIAVRSNSSQWGAAHRALAGGRIVVKFTLDAARSEKR